MSVAVAVSKAFRLQCYLLARTLYILFDLIQSLPTVLSNNALASSVHTDKSLLLPNC